MKLSEVKAGTAFKMVYENELIGSTAFVKLDQEAPNIVNTASWRVGYIPPDSEITVVNVWIS